MSGLHRAILVLSCALLAALGRVYGQPYPPVDPNLIYSSHFTLTVDGAPVPVMHAALNLYFSNVVAAPHHHITVTAPTDDFWASGVEVEPWRLNIRPAVHGRVLDFDLAGVAQITLSRPNDFGSEAEMLYVFANPPETQVPSPADTTVRFFPPGVYRADIDAHSGDSIYLAPGAVLFGSLNLWQVHDVHVFGRGVLVYDGPQNPADDDGWMHKPNWHCIVMDQARAISIEGLTCVVRSRTWQIQMKDSHAIVFDNIKVIGANAGNANADGMDWLGGGDTVVRNSFFRAADDIFAMQSSWDGYTEQALAAQGQPVRNILVENTVLSTSISNVVRAAWPKKNFEGGDFTLRNSDVLHMGLGGCGVPFALLGMWATPAGRGQSSGFHFNGIRLEHWNTLFQLLEPTPGIGDVTFTDTMALEEPARVPSLSSGSIDGVKVDSAIEAGVYVGKPEDIPATSEAGASPVSITPARPRVELKPVVGLVRPGQKVHFEATASAGSGEKLRYTWLFGDGGQSTGRKVSHRFPDAGGSLHDGTGRFRVLLHVSSSDGREQWLYQPVIVTPRLMPPVARSGTAPVFSLAETTHPDEDYDVTLAGDVEVPNDGGYVFLLVANDAATLTLDGVRTIRTPSPIAQVCGLAGNAAQLIELPAALARGTHHLVVTEHHGKGKDDLALFWQGPGFGATRLRSADAAAH